MFTRRRLLLALLLLVLGGLGAAGWYVATKGFTRSWRTMIAAEFEKQGIELTFRRLTLDPFRGLVAQEVKLLDARNRRRPLATIDEMVLGVNYGGWMRGDTFLDWVDFRDASIALTVDPAHPEKPLSITRLNARVFLPPQQIHLPRAEAEILGLHVYATGKLINPQALTANRAPEDPTGREPLRAILGLLSSLRYKSDPPVLSLEFSGDLARPSELAIDARLYGEDVKHQTRNYTLEHIWAVASYRQGTLELRQFGMADGKGELRAAATWHPATGQLFARIVSGLAAHDFWRAFVSSPQLPELQLGAPPRLDLTLEGFTGQPETWSLVGHVQLERFAWRGIPWHRAGADVSWRGGRWSLRDVQLQHQSGTLRGDVVMLPGDFRATARGAIHPHALSPLLDSRLNEWLRRFDFTDLPAVTLEFRGRAPTLDDCAGEGQVRFGRATYDGAPAQNFTAALRFARGTLSLTPFAPREDDPGTPTLIFDLRRNESRLEKRETGARPSAPVHGRS